MSDIHLGSGLAVGTSWSRQSWTRLGSNTLCSPVGQKGAW